MDKSKIKKYRNYSIAIAITAVVITGGIFGYRYLKRITTPAENAVKAIPLSSSCVIEFKNIQSLWETVSSNNKMWKAITKLPFFAELNNTYRKVDSICMLDNDVKEIISSQKFFISMHKKDSGSFNFLYVLQLNSGDMEGKAESFVKNAAGKKYHIVTEKINENNLHTVKTARNTDVFSFYCIKGVFAASFNKLLAEESINGFVKNQSIADNKYFSKLSNMAGKNVAANIYINVEDFGTLLGNYTSPDYQEISGFVKNFTNWVELDLDLKESELLLSGYTIPNLSEYFIECFIKQTPQQIEIPAVVPYNTELLIYFGFSNFERYSYDRAEYLHVFPALEKISDTMEVPDYSDTASIQTLFTNYTGSEVAFVKADYYSGDYGSNVFAVIRSQNIDRMKLELSNVSEKPVDSASGRKVFVNRLKGKFALADLYGNIFDSIKNNYFIIIDEYVIFGNNPETLKMYMLNIISGKTLDHNINYKAFSEKISGQANLFLYVNLRKAADIYERFLDYDIATEINRNYSVLKDFEALGIQFSNEKNGYYNNVYLKYNEKYSEENTALWESRLDTTVATKPYFSGINDTSGRVAVFDIRNNMYLFDLYGERISKTRINDKPLSRVFKIDIDKKPYLAFNTNENLYVVDIFGKIKNGFPVKLPFKASAGMVVTGNGNESGIIFPGTNKKVYKIGVNGKVDKSWSVVTMQNIVNGDLQLMNIKGKEFVVITDKDGAFQIVDKNGKQMMKPKQSIKKAAKSFFYPVFSRNNLVGFASSDKSGSIFVLRPDGSIEKISTTKFSARNMFILPVTEKSSEWFNYSLIDNTTAYIYGADKKLKCKADLSFSPEFAEIIKVGETSVLSSPSSGNIIFLSDCNIQEYPFVINSTGVESAGEYFGDNYILTSAEKYVYCFFFGSKKNK